jgi:methylated-DNA-protein-cysteine methyltransferase-like protein
MTEFESSLYNILARLPQGKLTTYGQLAKQCGYPSHARLVGRTLSKLPKDTKLPWFRVVNSQGKISLAGDAFVRQKEHLSAEGIDINENGKVVNFRHYL